MDPLPSSTRSSPHTLISPMYFTSLFVSCILASFFTGSAFSAPATSSPKCVTYQTGYLSTHEILKDNGSPTGKHKWFAFNYRNELAFFHQTPHPRIYAQFQQCTPNWANSTNFSFTKWGRIYIPQYKQCLAVTEPYGPQPYVVKRVPCLNSAAGEMATPKSIPQNWDVDSRGFMTWTGKTKEDGSLVQGDGSCKPGAYGYLSDKHHEPITGKSGEYRASLVCIWDQDAAAFYMTQN